MLAFLTSLLSLATVAAASPDTNHVSIPTSAQSWRSMTDAERNSYARVTVQALRHSPTFAMCKRLNPDLLEIKISEMTEDGSPLIMAVASAAYAICDPASNG